jgi:hypothetical protein
VAVVMSVEVGAMVVNEDGLALTNVEGVRNGWN